MHTQPAGRHEFPAETRRGPHAADLQGTEERPTIAVADFSARPFGRCGLLPPRSAQAASPADVARRTG